jgi:hypothetical protein
MAMNIEHARGGDGDAGLSTPAAILANGAGLGMFPEGTWLTQGLKGDGTLGKDRRKQFYDFIGRKFYEFQLKTKGVLDSTAAIIHTTTDQEIIDTTRKETPLMELIPMETARGKVTSYDVLTARGAAYAQTEADSLTTTYMAPLSSTYVNATKNLTIWTGPSGWGDFALSALASQYPTRDARALAIRDMTWSLNETWENELLNGGTTLESAYNTGGHSGGESGFLGIRGEIIGSASTYASLNANKSGGSFDDTDIDSMIGNMVQLNVKPNLAVTDIGTWQKIKQLMMALVRYVNPETEIAWGLKALAWNTPYGVMPIIASKFMPTTSQQHEILFLDTKFLAQRVLLDSTMEMFAKTALQQTFVIKKFGVFIDKTDSVPHSWTYNTNPSTSLIGTSKMGRIYGIA